MASAKFLESYIISPETKHTHTIILLHGRGDNGRNFAESLLEESPISRISSYSNCKWIFPSAPSRWSTAFKEDMPEWFDLSSTSNPRANIDRQVEGLRGSVQYISSLIQKELQELPARNILLGGISQGFAVAAHVLFTFPQSLGGFVGISGWVPYDIELRELVQTGNSLPSFYRKTLDLDNIVPPTPRTRCVLTHSKDDPTINLLFGMSAYNLLRSFGFNVDIRLYRDGGHWLQEPDGYENLASFFQLCINESMQHAPSTSD